VCSSENVRNEKYFFYKYAKENKKLKKKAVKTENLKNLAQCFIIKYTCSWRWWNILIRLNFERIGIQDSVNYIFRYIMIGHIKIILHFWKAFIYNIRDTSFNDWIIKSEKVGLFKT